jgi:uncharacterized membrane protein YoaK (UPF0700 family)
MLTARAYTLRQKSRLAISLSWIAGYTNVVSLIYCGVMTSHMTGNVTHFAEHGAEIFDRPSVAIPGAAYCLYLIGAFIVGAIASGIMMQTARRHQVRSQYILPIAVEGVLLLALSGGVIYSLHHSMTQTLVWWMTGVACCAMGLQNATITQVSGSVVRTTHLTGVLTDLGTDTVALYLWIRDKTRRRGTVRWRRVSRAITRHPSAHRVALLSSIAGSFLIGVLAGTLVTLHAPMVALMPPVVFLLFIVWLDYYQPIADIKLVDTIADLELLAHGIDRSMLPETLAIYHVAPRLSGTQHHAPNFTAWADDLPKRCRVVIMSLNHFMHFDAEAALDLQAAAQKLAARDRRIILSGIRDTHYDVLDRYGVTRTIDIEDLCPDLEFAVARAYSLLRSRPR